VRVAVELTSAGGAAAAAGPTRSSSTPFKSALDASALIGLQRVAGNAAVTGGLLRGAGGPAMGDARAGRVPAPSGAGAARRPGGAGAVTLQRRVEDRPETHPVLSEGSDGPDVEQLQARLNDEGVADPPLEVDGIFGPLTAAAVREFQARHGLAVDAVVGIRTWGTLDELERRGIAGPTSTVLDEVTPVTTEQHNTIEGILHPTHPGGGGPGPEMTGRGPGGDYERQVMDALDRLAAETIARPVATPAVGMDHANRVGDRAQEEVEAFFGSTITLAARRPTGAWHPGSSRMGLADATTRPVSDGDVLGWADYFMDNGSYEPAQIAQTMHYDGTRARPDRAEHDRVRDLWLRRGGRSKVTQMIRAWPAEAGSGTVFLQLRDPGYQDRVGMWSLFATLVHEFLHLVTHPNYDDAANAVGGGGRDVLVEGMDEHMKTQVWDAVRPRIASDTTLRTLVEGPFAGGVVNNADYDSGSDIDNRIQGDHYDSMGDADAIASEVGEPNARAAYFMGHVEAIGLGAGSAGESSLDGLASWTPLGGGQPDQYVVPPAGETVAQVRERTGSTHVEDASGSVWVDVTHRFAGGETLRVPGIRWHTAIAQDTRAQVANQHGVSQEALERANRLAHAAPATRVAPGTVLLVPVAS
jgi:hypothetical protein